MLTALVLFSLLSDHHSATDPTASPYPLMGEYLTTTQPRAAVAEGADKPKRSQEVTFHGVQVRPLPDDGGKKQYELVIYPGGLPGNGWNPHSPDDAPSRRAVGVEEAERVVATMMRVDRTSPTIGLPAPNGAVVLFDAADPNLDHWAAGAELLDGYLKAGAESEQTFGSGTLHVEYRVPLQVEKLDTWRGNSGVYIQNRYEVQVLESFGDIIRDNGSGSIYKLHTPPQNMALPPGVWQTLDIVFTAASFDGETKTEPARMTVRHNGVTLFDDVPVPTVTNGNKLAESPSDGPLHLQDHGDPVVYRSVWFQPAQTN